MQATRRHFLQLLSGALTILPGSAVFAKELPNKVLKEEIAGKAYFLKQGYELLPARPLITGHEFNGGLLYDDTQPVFKPGNWVVVQDCGRLEDIKEPADTATLAHFHILSVQLEKPAYPGELLSPGLDYLINTEGLDPEKLVIVSIEQFKPYAAIAARFGIDESQIVYRSLSEAKAAGDGSGFFRPEGHPYTDGRSTVSIHYAASNDIPTRNISYSLQGLLELGEVGLNLVPEIDTPVEAAGFGIERIKMALDHDVHSHKTSKLILVEKLNKEASARGVDLPRAYHEL